MYKHKLTQPQSALIKYRGNTGQIDVQATIINILSKNPGLRGVDIANLIYDKDLYPLSHGYVYRVLGDLTATLVVARTGRLYYLFSDAVSHDMTVTMSAADQLDKIGVDLTKARFLSSGLIMAGENAIAEANGMNWDPDQTVAAGLASAPEPESVDEVEAEDEYQLPEGLDLENPFPDMTDSDREELRREADRLIAEDIAREKQEREEAESAARAKARKEKLASFSTAQSLLGATVEINPGKYAGQVIGTILELRQSGVTFLITFSSAPAVAEGTVLPVEYADGVNYRIVLDDFDAEIGE